MTHSSILFVCAANVCRSPMAEALLKVLLVKSGEPWARSITVSSAGTSNTRVSDASDQALMVMRERGIDMSRHKSRPISRELVDQADLILCMETHHVSTLEQAFPESGDKLHLLTEYCGSSGDIPDPSGKPTLAYELCARQMEELMLSLIEKIK
jgi:protein-tyrosine-phosphatase